MLRGVAGMGASRAFQQLRDAESILRSDLWERYVALAQRRALLWWRDRRTPPGVAARVTVAGASYYNFGKRSTKPAMFPPYYHIRGNLLRALLRRNPKTSRGGGSVSTRLAFGGGSLNFLTTPRMRSIVGWTLQTSSATIGGVTRSITRKVPVRGGDTYAAAWGRFDKDRKVIEARVAIELRKIVRQRALTKAGDWRKSVLQPVRGNAA